MKNNLNVAILQSKLVWEQPGKNRLNFETIIKSISEEVDLFVLPEMFTSGFTMNPENVAESMQGDTITWMKLIANKYNAAIAGSVVILENSNYYNRLLFVHPAGEINYYDKRHLFTLAGEHFKYTAGTNRLIVDYLGWKICPLVCYDLRFPVWARNTNEYDILLYVANWPKVRINAWDALLKARAIENLSYVLGVNRVGVDENSLEYPGHSVGFNYLGDMLTNLKPNEEGFSVITLNRKDLIETRSKLNFLNDGDSFELKM